MKTPTKSLLPVLGSNVFALSAWIAALFVFAVVAISFVVMWRTNTVLVGQVVASIDHEAQAIAADYRQRGLQSVLQGVRLKSQIDGPAIYYFTRPDGVVLAGNIENRPPSLAADARGTTFSYTRRSVMDRAPQRGQGVALQVPLGGEAVGYVGRDITDITAYASWLRWFFGAAFLSLSLAALAASYAISRRFLTRLAHVNETVDAIMQGDLADRVPLSGEHDELDELSRNLNLMLDRINQLMIGLREVSDNIAHDLKTPLNRLRNRAEGALRDPRGGSAYKEGLERTIEEADGLIRTFNALLLIARLEAHSLEETASTFDVADILDDVSELYQPVAEEQGLDIKLLASSPVSMRANKQLIMQAVANLIDNAIKYGGQGVSKQQPGAHDAHTITAEVVEDGDFVVIRVGDHGPGINAADRERVLQRFVRLEESRTQPGTGLGLSLVAAVARMHGGAVQLDDNAPGLKVSMRLPRRMPSDGRVQISGAKT